MLNSWREQYALISQSSILCGYYKYNMLCEKDEQIQPTTFREIAVVDSEVPFGIKAIIIVAVCISGYIVATGQIHNQNCDRQYAKLQGLLASNLSGHWRVDPSGYENIAVERVKVDLACSTDSGILIGFQQPAEVTALTREPRIVEKAKALWNDEHGLLGWPRN